MRRSGSSRASWTPRIVSPRPTTASAMVLRRSTPGRTHASEPEVRLTLIRRAGNATCVTRRPGPPYTKADPMNPTSPRTRKLAPLTVAAVVAACFLVGPGVRAAGAQTDAFIVNTTPGTVTVISTAVPPSHPPVTVTVGPSPSQVVISPDGKFAYVANSGGTTVSRIDAGTFDVKNFDVGGMPTGLAVSSTDLFVLLNPDSVVDFSLATDPPQQFGNPIAVGSAFGGMAITPGTPQQLWVATGAVTVIDTATFSALTQFIPEQIHDPNVYNFAVGVAISS